MKHRPQTLVVTTQLADRAVDAAIRSSSRNAGITLVFLAGALVSQAEKIANALSVEASSRDFLIACAPTILTEKGELENEDTAGLLTIPTFSSLLIEKRLSEGFLQALKTALSDDSHRGAVLLFRDHESSQKLQEYLGHQEAVFGGGTLNTEDLLSVQRGVVESGSVAALLIDRASLVQVRTSTACRLLGPLAKITACQGGTLLEIDGSPALDLMSDCARGVEVEFPLHLAAASVEAALSAKGRKLASIPIRGIDPSRSAILFDEILVPETRVAFAVPDSLTARRDLEAHADDLVRNSRGSSPEWGIYICSSHRNREFYGRSKVDLQILANRFPNLPIIGLHSAFELAPLDGKLLIQNYSGVFALFSCPS